MLVKWVDRCFYPNDQNMGTSFREILLDSYVEGTQRLLDLGAGRGAHNLDLRGSGRKVFGADVGDEVFSNPFIDEPALIKDGILPYEDDFFDLVVSEFVWEHIEHPVKFLKEAHRVLKPGGIYISRHPSAWHYVSIFASITPHWFHVWYTGRLGRKSHDVFPTYYRMNTPRQIRKIAEKSGFEVEKFIQREGKPGYLRLWGGTYFIGAIYERIVNSSEIFGSLRSTQIAILRKKGTENAR